MDALAATRFEGDVWAVPEGTVVFPGETLLRVDGPAAAGSVGRNVPAGLARLSDPGGVEGGPDRRGGRRPAALRVRRPARARAARRLAGGAVGHDRRLRRDQPRRGRAAAGHPGGRARWPIPGSSRSPTEAEAFAAFARVFPGNATLLVDTYDTLEGVRHAAAIEPPIQAIRIDSGDLGEPGPAGSRDPRRARPLEREDHRLGRSRRIPDRPSSSARVRRSTASASEPS